MGKVEQAVKGMVLDQLRKAGFDPDLSAGAFSSIQNVTGAVGSLYASIVGSGVPGRSKSLPYQGYLTRTTESSSRTTRQEDRREEKFWECRRSLRLWSVKGADRASVVDFLNDKMRMDATFIDDELGH